MIRINGYLHRGVFFDLIRRWMYNQTDPSDAELVTRLVHFNNVFVVRYLQIFSETVFGALHGRDFEVRTALRKCDLKDEIVANPPYVNARIEELILAYRNHPERYYRETPFEGTLYLVPRPAGDLYVGSNRVKRVRRLAEKSARRIIDSIFEAIKRRADALAEDRARKLGVQREQLVTRPEDMEEEFFRAEDRLLDDLRNLRPIQFDRELEINDVAGIKVIAEDTSYARIPDLFRNLDGCEIVEEEPHTGKYNATNLIIRYRPPKDEILRQPLGNGTLRLMERRGLDPDRARQAFGEFVEQGEDQVHIEVIVSNYQEMLESEIGRCMHEDRITAQRMKQEYHGHLAKNIEYLILFLFNFAVSPQTELGELPVRLWNRYLPDTFDEVVRSLFEIPPLRLVE